MDKKLQQELLAVVQKNYQEIAGQYDETRRKHLEPLWNKLVELAREVKDGDRVLDVGCGNGRLLEAFEGTKIEYLGIDSSEKLLEHAKINKPVHEFKKGNILNLDNVPEVNFDYVFSVAVLHHLPGKDLQIEALKQLKAKLSKEGKIIMTVWNMWSQKKFRKSIFRFLALKLINKNKMDFGDILFDWKNQSGRAVSKRYYHAFRGRELKSLIRQAGLIIDRFFKDKYNFYIVLKKP